MPDTNPNYLDMPDDEVMGMSRPAEPVAIPESEPVVEEVLEAEPVVVEEVAPLVQEVVEPVDILNTPDDASEVIPTEPVKVTESVATEVKEPVKAQESEPKVTAEPTAEDHKSFYDRILKNPIKANGKEIQLRNPEEVERLIQMGLNYTKKMQSLQPRMRVVTMLENNGLLDPAKLSHLIDLSKGDQGAIQKLLADSKFDPIEIDADKAASYKPGSHQVSDKEMSFNAALDDLESTDTGAELITEVAKQWDEQSRQAVYQDPSILAVINEQKALGLYARITGEMDRLKTLGHLQGTPFLQAYRAVGEMLHDQGMLNPMGSQKQPEPKVPTATRVATPAPQVTNSEKAKAASPTKATPVTAAKEINYLDIPDEDFIKSMQGRL